VEGNYIPSASEQAFEWLPTNLLDVRPLSAADKMPDFCFPEQGIYIQCKHHIVDYAAIETLVAVPQTDGFGASGQFFSALDQARQQILIAKIEAEEQLRQFVASLQSRPTPQIERLPSALTFEQLLEIFNQQPSFSYTSSVGMLSLLLAGRRLANLLRRVYTRMAEVPMAVVTSGPRFCGLSWSRRLWFLLHGSHPPKTECCPAFGGD
jgi:hypothetical protein